MLLYISLNSKFKKFSNQALLKTQISQIFVDDRQFAIFYYDNDRKFAQFHRLLGYEEIHKVNHLKMKYLMKSEIIYKIINKKRDD